MDVLCMCNVGGHVHSSYFTAETLKEKLSVVACFYEPVVFAPPHTSSPVLFIK